MKLNKLTSAVSVSLLAVALTACGSDDDAPIINSTTTAPAPTPAATPAPTPATTPAPATNTADLIAAFKAAGLSDAKAAELAAANPTVTAGSAEFNALVTAANTPAANNGTGEPVSEEVVRANPFINGVDTNKFATVTANQYSRQPGSNFDRSANPVAQAGLGAVGTDNPTKQNPYLSNYVLAVEVSGGKIVAIDSTGELVVPDTATNKTGKVVDADKSPYVAADGLYYTAQTLDSGTKNFVYGDAAGAPAIGLQYDLNKANNHATKVAPEALGNAATSGIITNFTTPTEPKIYTIQDVNLGTTVVSTANAEAALKEAKEAKATFVRNPTGELSAVPTGLDSGLIVYNSKSIPVGNTDGANLGYKVPAYGVEENIYDENGVALNAAESLEVNSTGNNQNRTPIFLAKEVVQYSAADGTGKIFHVEKYKASNDKTAAAAAVASGTAVMDGGKFAETDPEVTHLANNVANAFETRIFGKNYNHYNNAQTENSYVGRYNSKNQLSNVGVTTLSNVQYGRLTNNIDVLADKDTNTRPLIYRQFQQHGADNSVDTYFYRGTNHTTVGEMEALKAKGGTIQYYGHALTYGVGPIVDAAAPTPNTLPTAYGPTQTPADATIGNFVEAKFDVAKSTVNGNVYNFRATKANPTNTDFVKQDLIGFKGDVYGNTVTGTADKKGTTEIGTFTGSFFGSAANELGGSISSISRSAGYDAPKWGAVFGATKGSSVENFNVIEQGQNQGGN